MPAQLIRTSILLCSSPLPSPCSLKFVVLQKSGEEMEPEMYACFAAPDCVGVSVDKADSRFSFEREINVQR